MRSNHEMKHSFLGIVQRIPGGECLDAGALVQDGRMAVAIDVVGAAETSLDVGEEQLAVFVLDFSAERRVEILCRFSIVCARLERPPEELINSKPETPELDSDRRRIRELVQTYGVSIGQDVPVLDVQANIGIRDLKATDELANEDPCHAGTRILVRVISDKVVHTLHSGLSVLIQGKDRLQVHGGDVEGIGEGFEGRNARH